jgi:hypothetical protein
MMKLCVNAFEGSQIGTLVFEPESRLTEFGFLSFSSCSAKSICIPRCVEVLCAGCFLGGAIETLTFETGSCLTDIEELCFEASQLDSICIHRSVELLGTRPFALPILWSGPLLLTQRVLRHRLLGNIQTNDGARFERGNEID